MLSMHIPTRALHEDERRRKGGFTRNQFFLVAFACSFAYYAFPGYLFQMLTSLSWICWVFPNSVFSQQLGSGLHGLGIAAIGLDWASISSYLGSPLVSPWFATANVAAGFFIVMYIIVPIGYWFDFYKAQTFPIFSSGLFTSALSLLSHMVSVSRHLPRRLFMSSYKANEEI